MATASGGLFSSSANGLIIPEPQISIPVNVGTTPGVNAKWHSESQEFLNYNPEYFLFRYAGTKNYGNDGNGNERGYRHPSHQNGVKYPAGSFYAGADMNNSGSVQPGRDTEWAVAPTEGTDTLLIPPSDYPNWFTLNNNAGNYPAVFTPATPPSSIQPAGRGNASARAAYFYVAIAIDIRNNNTGCPKTFGPASQLFQLRAVQGLSGTQIVAVIGDGKLYG